MDLIEIINTYNGAITLSSGAVEWGFVSEDWFLCIPEGCTLTKEDGHTLGQSPFGEKLNAVNFIKANYHAAFRATNNADKALTIALLRYHIATCGLLDMDINARCVSENEYVVVKHNGADWAAAENNIPDNPKKKEIAKWAKRFGDTIIHCMVYVFSARGHHWQPGYDELYNRLIKATGIDTNVNFTIPTHTELFRSTFHAFGVKIPLDYAHYCIANGKMSNPLIIRFDPNPPIAGAAQALTSLAVIDHMKNEKWFNFFREKFDTELGIIQNECASIRKTPYQYHVASRVLTGYPKINYTPDFIKASKIIGSYLLGYIEYLGRKNSLANQTSLTQHLGPISPEGELFIKACEKFSKISFQGDDMKAFLANI